MIPDRKNVRKALECIAEDRQKSCTRCEYSIFGLYPFCIHGIARYALELLKEQEAQVVLLSKQYEIKPLQHIRIGFCPRCDRQIAWLFCRNYCGFCGQEVKWE